MWSCSAQTWRTKYSSTAAYDRVLKAQRVAVVMGATSGIGQACANRLAEQGFTVLAVGRDRPGRADQIIQMLKDHSAKTAKTTHEASSSSLSIPNHQFYPCDAFSLANIRDTAKLIQKDHPKIDALVMTQGMATLQGFTPTMDGNDEKLTLHYFSRMAMIASLLPALMSGRTSSSYNDPTKPDSTAIMPAVVVSVLSGGVHGPYRLYETDFTLEHSYSIKHAADAAGYYNDLGLDAWAHKVNDAADNNNNTNKDVVRFVHASPGFVNTNWGTEFPTWLRGMVRFLQPLGRSPMDCADCLMGATVLATENGDGIAVEHSVDSTNVYIVGPNGQGLGVTKEHSPTARDFVWERTMEILQKAGITWKEGS